jgi:hypothetical protein
VIGFGVIEWRVSLLKFPEQKTQQTSAARTNNKLVQIGDPDKADDRIARYTFWLAMFTGALVIVSAVQIRYLIRADRTARISAIAARRSAIAAKKSADAAIAVDLPMVAVVGVELDPSSSNSAQRGDFPPAVKSRIVVSFENFGRTPAALKKTCQNLRVCKTLPARPLYDGIEPFPTGTVLKKERREQYATKFDFQLSSEEVIAVHNEETNLWIYGFIEYQDFLGSDHTIGYCTKWIKGGSGTGQFIEDGPKSYIYHS